MTAEKLTNEDLVAIYLKDKNESVLDQLIKQNAGILYNLAFKAYGKCRGEIYELEDFYQLSCIGLIQSIPRYKPELGYRFSSFISQSVSLWLINCIKSDIPTVRLPNNAAAAYYKYKKLPENILTEEEKEFIKLINRTRNITSLNTAVANDSFYDDIDLLDLQIDPNQDVDDEVTTNLIMRDVRDALSEFPEREQLIIERSFFHAENLREIGKQTGLSRERVRQIKDKTIKKLRIKLNKKGYRENPF